MRSFPRPSSRSIRSTPLLLLVSFMLASADCRHAATTTAQSNQPATSQAQSGLQPANTPAQPVNPSTKAQAANDTPVQPVSNPAQSAAGSAPATAAAAAGPAAPTQGNQASQQDQSSQSAQPVRPAPNGSAEATAQAAENSRENQPSQATIPEGTPIDIRLIQTLSSVRSVGGDRFAASLDAPIVVGNAVVVPRGASVRGRVVYAKRSGRLKGPAILTLTLNSVEVGGQSYRIVTAHKIWRGKSHKKRNLAWIGGGGGAGSLVGLAAGGGVGAAIGAGVGAGGGTVTALVTGRKNIVLPSETRLRFVLRRPLTVG